LTPVAYQIAIEKTPNFICVTVDGPANFDNISGVWKDIARACTEFGCSNVLLDGILRGRPSTLDIYRTGNRIHLYGLPRDLRVAFVCTEEDLPRLSFHESVIADRAIGVTIRNFLDRVDAERWLAEAQCACQSGPAGSVGRGAPEELV